MKRANFHVLTLMFALLVSPAPAQSGSDERIPELPVIPDSTRVLSVEEVKNYWVNKLPEPSEPSRLARGYQSLIVDYHRQVGERHRLIQAIRAGKFDRLAKLIMLRHNLQAYILLDDDEQVAALEAELAEIEEVAKKEAERQAEVDRIERLIAATERLAAAIENAGESVPDNAYELADEIVPFESSNDDYYGSVVSYLYNEIALCGYPIITHRPHVYRPRVHHHQTHTHVHPSHRGGSHTSHRDDVVVRRPSQLKPTTGTVSPRIGRSTPAVTRTSPARSQPQVRRSPMPSQPRVAPVRAPSQPRIPQAR